MKQKTDELTKEKRIYTIELMAFMILFLILGILILAHILPVKGTFRKVLIYVSLFGSLWLIIDFIWTLASPKRRAKQSLLDKFLALPAAGSVLAMDLVTFIQGFDQTIELHEIFVGILFCYLAVVYLVEAIYHWFKPLPMLLEDLPTEKEAETTDAQSDDDFLSKLEKAQQKRDEDKQQ